jgi:hypothetical protein
MAKRRRAPRHPRASVAEMIEDDTLRELEPNEHIRKLMRQGFEEAFRAQIGLLYRTYLTAPDREEQRARTATGMRNAIEAYRLAMAAIDEWKG